MDAIIPVVKYLKTGRFEDLPADIIESTKINILDTLGCILAGSTALGCPELVEQITRWGGREESSIINSAVRVPAPLAALVNATMARAIDFDDVFEEGTAHVSASIIPAAFAAAEMCGGINGREFITAVAAASEILCRLSLANKIPPGVSGMNATFQYAYFGCAGAAARILGLDETKMHHAMGLAYTQVAGNSQNLIEGTMATRLNQGLAAQGGILAAIFAGIGYTAAAEVLEGKCGYFRTYQRNEYDRERLLEGLGQRFYGSELSRKLYPCCMHTHSAIEAVKSISSTSSLSAGEVKSIRVGVNQQGFNFVCSPPEKKRNPQTVPEAQFSLPYAVAAMLVKGEVTIESFLDTEITNSEVLRVSRLVNCYCDPEIEKKAKSTVSPAVVEIETIHGRMFRKTVDARKGSSKNPLSMEEVAQKFRSCAASSRMHVQEEKIEAFIEQIKRFEILQNVSSVLDLLG